MGGGGGVGVGILEVLVGEAKGIENKDLLGCMDPYVIVKYKGQQRKTSVASGQGCNPVWNEKLRFKVDYDPAGSSGSDYKLIVRIMDKDTFSSDDFVGEATIYVEDLVGIGTENGSCELHPSKYRVVAADGERYFGEIKLGLTFTLTEEEDEEKECGGWKESD